MTKYVADTLLKIVTAMKVSKCIKNLHLPVYVIQVLINRSVNAISPPTDEQTVVSPSQLTCQKSTYD